MANYNKYINTFSGATDVQEWNVYIDSEAAGFPNVAYLETSDIVKYTKFSKRVPYGTILYDDLSITLPTESIDTTKEPLAMLCVEKSEALDGVPRWFWVGGVIGPSGATPTILMRTASTRKNPNSGLSFPSGFVQTNSTDLTNSELWNGVERTELIYGANSGDTQQLYAATFAHNFNLQYTDTTAYVPALGELRTAFPSVERFLYYRTRLEAINTAYGTTKATTFRNAQEFNGVGFLSSNFYNTQYVNYVRVYRNNNTSSYPLTDVDIQNDRYAVSTVNPMNGIIFLKLK